jgi:hypothetical protein
MVAFTTTFAQDIITIDGKPCGMSGDARKGSLEAAKDPYKNAYTPCSAYSVVSFTEIAALKVGDTHYKDGQGITISGYVIEVKDGGSETCNCHTKDKTYYDTHIVLSNDPNDTNPAHGIVVEITPRWRAKMPHWTTSEIKKTYLHKWVTVQGAMFNDAEHKPMSSADGATTNAHRATCWELHPVHSIQIK